MIIPKFLMNSKATLNELQGVNGRGESIMIQRWQKPCYVVTRIVKTHKNGVYTRQLEYKITIEKSDVKIGDTLDIDNRLVEIVDIPFPKTRSRYMELIGYGKEKQMG